MNTTRLAIVTLVAALTWLFTAVHAHELSTLSMLFRDIAEPGEVVTASTTSWLTCLFLLTP